MSSLWRLKWRPVTPPGHRGLDPRLARDPRNGQVLGAPGKEARREDGGAWEAGEGTFPGEKSTKPASRTPSRRGPKSRSSSSTSGSSTKASALAESSHAKSSSSVVRGAEVVTLGTDAWVKVVHDDARAQGRHPACKSWGHAAWKERDKERARQGEGGQRR